MEIITDSGSSFVSDSNNPGSIQERANALNIAGLARAISSVFTAAINRKVVPVSSG